MKNFYTVFLFAILLPFFFTLSCKQLFTTSLGTPLERDDISISDNASLSSLVELANSNFVDDPEGAKTVLGALGNKDKEELKSLPVEDKTVILDMATTSTLEIATILELLDGFTSGTTNTNTLMTDIFNAFDSNVELGAIETLLSDPDTLANAPVNSVLMASVVLAADLIEDRGAQNIMDILAGGTVPADFSEAEKARLNIISNVTTTLTARSTGEDTKTPGGFNLLDLLKGTI